MMVVVRISSSSSSIIKMNLGPCECARSRRHNLLVGNHVPSVPFRRCSARSLRCLPMRKAHQSSSPQLSFDTSLSEVSQAIGFTQDRLELKSGPNGRGLFAKRRLNEGDTILAVPLSLCILAEREEAIHIPGVPWDEHANVEKLKRTKACRDAYVLPWPIRSAVALLDLADGSGGRFWEEYTCHENGLLPAPEEYSMPLMLPDDLLDMLADATCVETTREERSQLCQLLGEVDSVERRGALWAAACVRSRNFALTDELFAVAPFLDMANHAAQPNAEVGTQATAIARLKGVPTGNLQIVATRPIEAGDEVTISYGPNMTNEQLFARYGFTMSPPPPRDAVEFAAVLNAEYLRELAEAGQAPPRPPLRLNQHAFVEANGASDAESWAPESDAVLRAAMESLPLDEADTSSELELELNNARELLEEAMIRLDGAVDPDVDETWLDEHNDGDDVRLYACVAYRSRRTRVWLRLRSLLETYVSQLEGKKKEEGCSSSSS